VSLALPCFQALADNGRGGMRGIVILEVLRQIEEELGRRIPVMNFFDLVVGTR
jgi:patatin-like phospholipase/acyl hydrolase